MKMQLVILGLGARSTLYYQNYLHKLYLKKHTGFATCPFTVKQIDFNLINPFLPNGAEVITPIIENELQSFNTNKTHLLVPNITLHSILDAIDFKLNIIHPITLLKNSLKLTNSNKAVVFGTRHTNAVINYDYILSNEHMSLISLEEEDIEFLDELRQKVYSHLETDKDLSRYKTLFKKYNNCIIIVSCTELSVINNFAFHNVLDLAKLQCHEAISLI
ncbi:hypothetical protein [Lacinutrix chionoecetis]